MKNGGEEKSGKGREEWREEGGKNGTNWKQNSKTTDDLYYFSKNNKVKQVQLGNCFDFQTENINLRNLQSCNPSKPLMAYFVET